MNTLDDRKPIRPTRGRGWGANPSTTSLVELRVVVARLENPWAGGNR